MSLYPESIYTEFTVVVLNNTVRLCSEFPVQRGVGVARLTINIRTMNIRTAWREVPVQEGRGVGCGRGDVPFLQA